MKKYILAILIITILTTHATSVRATEYTTDQITSLTNNIVSGFNSRHDFNSLPGIPYTYNGTTYTTLNQINGANIPEETKLDITARVLCGDVGSEWGKSLTDWQANNNAIYNKVAERGLCYAVSYHSLNMQELVKPSPDKAKITRGVYFTLLQIDFLSTKLDEIPIVCTGIENCRFNDFRLKYGSTYYASTYLLDAITGLYLGVGYLHDANLIDQNYTSTLEGKTVDLFARITDLSKRMYAHHAAEILASNYDPLCIGCISNRRMLYRAGGMYSLLALSQIPGSEPVKAKALELVATFFDHDYLAGRDKYEPSGFFQYWGIALSADGWAPLSAASPFKIKGDKFLNIFTGAYWPTIGGESMTIYAQDQTGKDLDSYDLTRLMTRGITSDNIKIGCSVAPNAGQWFTQTDSGRLVPNGMPLSAGLMTAFPQAYFIAQNTNPADLAQYRAKYGKYLHDLTNPWNIATPDDMVCSQIGAYFERQTQAAAALSVSNYFVAAKLFWDRIKFRPIVTNDPNPLPGDLTGDGHVNLSDYQLLLSHFGNPYTIFDYSQLVENFGK